MFEWTSKCQLVHFSFDNFFLCCWIHRRKNSIFCSTATAKNQSWPISNKNHRFKCNHHWTETPYHCELKAIYIIHKNKKEHASVTYYTQCTHIYIYIDDIYPSFLSLPLCLSSLRFLLFRYHIYINLTHTYTFVQIVFRFAKCINKRNLVISLR